MRAVTGLDLPFGTPGGSAELLRDLYLGERQRIRADAFMLAPAEPAAVPPGLAVLPVDGKTLDGADFWSYVDRLAIAVREAFTADAYDVVHLQHLAFGATPALQLAYPELPHIAIVHGTDLLFAEQHPTQAAVLRRTAATAYAVVVPTLAMADRLARLVEVPAGRLAHIPWGIPEDITSIAAVEQAPRSTTLRVLYAGRLTAEKMTPGILTTVAAMPGVELAVAAPPAEYSRMARAADLSDIHYLGWRSRSELWREFGRHDLLIVPSLVLEAFGLVAVEAQACGLPVAYQSVPGLAEVLGDSGLRVDFRDIDAVTRAVERLRTSPGLLGELRAAGLANSARFPLSATAAALIELSEQATA